MHGDCVFLCLPLQCKAPTGIPKCLADFKLSSKESKNLLKLKFLQIRDVSFLRANCKVENKKETKTRFVTLDRCHQYQP